MKQDKYPTKILLRRAAFAAALGLPTIAGMAAFAQQTSAAPERQDTAALSPQITSWFLQNSNRYARVVEQTGHTAVTTWPSSGLPWRGGGQSKPAYADIQQVSYSADWVYIKGTGLASHQMGPWYMGVNRIFDNWPSNQSYLRRFPRNPKPAATRITNGLGDLGTWVNGVALFNMLDGGHYDSAAGYEIMAPPGPRGQQDVAIWVRNAVPVEGPTFDKSNAHQPPMGTYHYHSNPLGLRYQLNDNVSYERATETYREDTSKLHHSPILGWSYDGYPIYGPYGYADPTNPASGLHRKVSGYVLRDGRHHTTDLRKTGRHSLAKWAAALHNTGRDLAAGQAGPEVNARYPLGRYCEDYDYLGDLGFTQGKDFDLDACNGRFCVTPEYPKGTYAYFVTLNEDGSAAFPYVIGRQYYGNPTGGNTGTISETVTTYRIGGAETPIQVATLARPDGSREIGWTSVEGAHYRVEASADGTTWKTVAADMPSQGQHTIKAIQPGAPAAKATQFRISLTYLDPFDNTPPRVRGPGGGPGGFGGPGNGRGVGSGGFGGPGAFGGRGPDSGGPGGGGPGGPGGPDGGPPGGFGGPGGPPNNSGRGPAGLGGGAGGAPTGTLDRIRPASGKRGAVIMVKLTPGGIMPPPPFVQPTSATIGAIKARKVTWDGEKVIAEFLLPAEAAAGPREIKVIFPGPPGSGFNVTFTTKSGFTIQ